MVNSLTKKVTEKRIREATKMVCTKSTCSHRGDPQPVTEFYKTNTETGSRYHICKTCVGAMINAEELETVYPVLRDLNIAFDGKLWFENMSKRDINKANAFGSYLKRMNLSTMKSVGFKDEQKLEKEDERTLIEQMHERMAGEQVLGEVKKAKDEVTSEMMSFWGVEWKEEDYPLLQDLYDKLKLSYPGATSLHVAALKNYVGSNVRYTQALQKNDVGEAGKWSTIMNAAANAAKITPKQLTKADLQGGLNSFSELILAVEQAIDVIPILPKYMHQPRDIPDFILWSYIDYECASAGKASPSYRDIYSFYEQRVKNYINETGDPEGMFDFIIPEEMHEKIENYIDLEK